MNEALSVSVKGLEKLLTLHSKANEEFMKLAALNMISEEIEMMIDLVKEEDLKDTKFASFFYDVYKFVLREFSIPMKITPKLSFGRDTFVKDLDGILLLDDSSFTIIKNAGILITLKPEHMAYQ